MKAIPFVLPLLAALLVGCATPAALPSSKASHLTVAAEPAGEIPSVVTGDPLLPAPDPEQKSELYSVTVKDVPVKELLFALARDAHFNVDVAPDIAGTVTLTAVDQPLPQILARVARQANLRYAWDRTTLVIQQDTPYLHSYKIDYVNVERTAVSAVSVATEIATTGVSATDGKGGSGNGNNNSTTTLRQESSNQFWESLVDNVTAILESGDETTGTLLLHRESGLLTVRATQRQHEEIQRLIDQIVGRAQQQVLIEATVVEVSLSDRFQAGVDWSMVDARNGITFVQALTGANLAAAPVTSLTIDRPGNNNLLATIKMLEQFGNLKVLSSPKVMALTNQTAILKVVDNRIYFTLDVHVQPPTQNTPGFTSYQSIVHTVPVGFVMAVTPQISDAEVVTLNVRPTISRVVGYISDPNPELAKADVVSQIPEIQVREIESVLKVSSGQIAVLGGLMQETAEQNRSGLPLLSRLPLIGPLFSYRDQQTRKTELVIFLRPTVMRDASLEGGLRDFRGYLSERHEGPSESRR